MPEVHGKILNGQAIIDVGVMRFMPPSASADPHSQLQISVTRFRALVDTGASGTCITTRVIKEIGLVSHSKAIVISAGTTKDHNEYLVDFAIWYGESGDQLNGGPQDSERGYYGAGSLPAIGIDNNSNFDVIVGMDFLEKHEFTIKQGTFILKLM